MPSVSASSNWRKDFEEAQSAGGTSAGTLYDLGAAACMRHDYADALKRFSEALARDGGMGRAYNNRGVTYFALGQYENALADFNTAQRLGGPSEKAALFNRALTYQTMRDLDRAMADYDRIIAADPGNIAARNNKADILLSLRRFDEAASLLDAAIAVAPNDPELYFNRALAREAMAQYPAAKADYDQALRQIGRASCRERV